MARREIPLFVFDIQRKHNIGAFDYLVCTDKDNGFVARVDYVTDIPEMATDTERVGLTRGGIAMRMEIKRFTGANVKPSEVRTLMKMGMDYCSKVMTVNVDKDSPSVHDCIAFLGRLIQGNRANLGKLSPIERATTQKSLEMLTATLEHLKTK